MGWWWRQSRAAVKRSATVGRRESPPDFCRLAGGGGDASNASHDCGLARELLGIGRKGNCECVGLCCRSFHEGTSWEERTRLAGRDLDADAALRRARHLFPEASSSRDCPPVECLVVRRGDLWERRPFRHPFNNPKKENRCVCGAPFCDNRSMTPPYPVVRNPPGNRLTAPRSIR